MQQSTWVELSCLCIGFSITILWANDTELPLLVGTRFIAYPRRNSIYRVRHALIVPQYSIHSLGDTTYTKRIFQALSRLHDTIDIGQYAIILLNTQNMTYIQVYLYKR